MNNKLILLTFAICIFTFNAICQVNLQKGSFQTSIPIYGFKDPLSKLSLSLSLDYSSGNGVLVDEIPSCIGQGWSLGGLGVITRIQRGSAPDDQVKKDDGDMTFRYPDGYIFNARPISDGCNKLLNKYPIYGLEHTQYYIKNRINADKEQDYFIFSFNGRTGKFVIDKDKNVHILGDSKLKFKQPWFDPVPVNNCRTLINTFIVVDENGIEYEFGYRDYSKNFDYYDASASFAGDVRELLKDHEIPDNYNPYVTNNWYLSKIIEPLTGRFISMSYKSDVVDMFSGYSAQFTVEAGTAFMCPSNPNPIVVYPNTAGDHPPFTSVLKQRMYVKKPEIQTITFPTEDVVGFKYPQQRKDCRGSYKLSEIIIKFSLGERTETFNLQQSYFVKNVIKEPINTEQKFARLVLQSVSKTVNGDLHKIAGFEYYTGTNSEENHVPPIFFHAKDPWGYYNGDYCGLNTNDFLIGDGHLFDLRYVEVDDHCYSMSDASILATYNSNPNTGLYPAAPSTFYDNTPYMRSNVKTMYAANGLISTLINEFGGKTFVTYEQNKVKAAASAYLFDSKHNSIDLLAVGGVHVLGVFEQESEGSHFSTSKYNYVLEDGVSSSLWGVEFPCNLNLSSTFYTPEDRGLSGFSCDYSYKYPGESRHVILADRGQSFDEIGLKILQYKGIITNVLTAFGKGDLRDLNSLLASIIVGIFTTCFGDYPTDDAIYFVRHNSILNFQNSLPAQFKRVEVERLDFPHAAENGKTVYEFTSPDDPQFPLLIPGNYFPYTNKPRFYDWAYGLPKSIKVYDKENHILKSTENNYQPVVNDYTGISTQSCNCSPGFSSSINYVDYENSPDAFTNTTVAGTYNYLPSLFVELYNQPAGHAELRSTTEKIFDKEEHAMESATDYEYNPLNFQVSKIKAYTSDERIIEKKIYYPVDFNISFPTDNIIAYMPGYNIINMPLVTETWQTNRIGEKELFSFNATDFEKQVNGDIKPKNTYQLITNRPIPLGSAGSLPSDNILRPIPEIRLTGSITYDANGNAVQANDIQADRVNCTVYGYGNQYPVASVSNAQRSEVAYTSFENGESGDWVINAGNFLDQLSPTGNSCLETNFQITAPVMPNIKAYKVSFWSTDNPGSAGISSLSPVVTGPEINGWRYYEFDIPAGFVHPVQISGKDKIDEVRLYPANAVMNTVTYYLSIGKSSECDANNRIRYYEYNDFGKLIIIRDAYRDILKTYEYHYKMQ